MFPYWLAGLIVFVLYSWSQEIKKINSWEWVQSLRCSRGCERERDGARRREETAIQTEWYSSWLPYACCHIWFLIRFKRTDDLLNLTSIFLCPSTLTLKWGHQSHDVFIVFKWSWWLYWAIMHFAPRYRSTSCVRRVLPQCHKWQNATFLCKPRSHMVSRQSWVTSILLMRSVRPLFALRLLYNSQRICQIDLKTKLWLLPSTRLLGVMNEICLDMSS